MLKKTLTKEDAQDALRAVLHDAGTYDIKDGSGGLNGSIVQECAVTSATLQMMSSKCVLDV